MYKRREVDTLRFEDVRPGDVAECGGRGTSIPLGYLADCWLRHGADGLEAAGLGRWRGVVGKGDLEGGSLSGVLCPSCAAGLGLVFEEKGND